MSRERLFQIFIRNLGEATASERVPRDRIEKYRGILPPALLKIWEEEGWCSYADGLMWTVDPNEYSHLAGMWLQGTPFETLDRYHIIARSAFGDLYVWGERTGWRITIGCPAGQIFALADKVATPVEDPDIAVLSFFAGLKRHLFDFRDDAEQFLFQRARESLGALNKNEMYGFEPALSLGGRAVLENLRKVNLDVHLTLLREFSAPAVPPMKMGSDS